MNRWFVLAMSVLLIAACSAAPSATQSASSSQHCQCLVCKHNADLACVDVEVDAKTPRVVYKGVTYYFCSDECKSEFEKHPEKYVAAAGKP